MTVIRLDAATLAALKAATGPVCFAGETGEPVLECVPYPVGQQPKYATEEAIVKMRGGRTLSEAEITAMLDRVAAVAGDGPEATDEEMDAMMRNDR